MLLKHRSVSTATRWSAILVAGFVLTSCAQPSFQTSSSVSVAPLRGGSAPRYQGLVAPIEQPVVVRMRPFPQSPFTVEEETSIVAADEEMSGAY